MNKKTLFKRIIVVMQGVSILYMLFIIAWASAYTVFVTDDFSHAMGVGAFHTDIIQYIKSSISYTITTYLGWQGTYFSMLFQAIMSPLNNLGLLQLRCIMIINAVAFFVSLIYLLVIVMNTVKLDNILYKMFIVMVVIFAITGYQVYTEVFFWFSGAASYSVPLTLLILAIANYLKYNNTHKRVNLVMAVLFGFMAMGGSLTIAGLGCALALMICIDNYKKENVRCKDYLILLIWVLGAAINALAPGNYMRHGLFDNTGVHPITAFRDAVYMANERWQFFFDKTDFVMILLLIILCTIFLGNSVQIEIGRYFYLSIAGVFLPIIVAFPLSLGYGGQQIPERCAFVIDVVIILSMINMAGVIGGTFNKKFNNESLRSIKLVLAICIFICYALDGYSIANVKIFEMKDELITGTYAEYYTACVDLYDYLDESIEGTDVIIPADNYPDKIDNFFNFILSEDPEYWTNGSVAKYYKLNSIAVSGEE